MPLSHVGARPVSGNARGRPPADQDRYLFWASAARVPSGALVTAAAGSNHMLTRKRFGSPQYAINHLRLHFSGRASTEGGTSPQENVVPGNPVSIDGVWVSVDGGPTTALAFAGQPATSFASGSAGAWTDDLALPRPIAADSQVDIYTLYHSDVGENQIPVHLIGATTVSGRIGRRQPDRADRHRHAIDPGAGQLHRQIRPCITDQIS